MSAPAVTSQTSGKYNARFFFDFVFGVIAPVLCLIADPVVFKGSASFLSTGGFLASFKIFAYVAIGLGVAAMALWLFFRSHLTVYSSYYLGIFTVAQIISFLFGLALLPLSVVGIFMSGLGLLGLIPFVTAFVFYRQRRIARADSTALPHRKRSAFWAALVVLAVPVLLQFITSSYVNSAVQDILSNPDLSPAASSRLKAAFWCGDECFYKLAFDYYRAYKDSARQQYIASVYHDITGGDIRTKTSNFSD